MLDYETKMVKVLGIVLAVMVTYILYVLALA